MENTLYYQTIHTQIPKTHTHFRILASHSKNWRPDSVLSVLCGIVPLTISCCADCSRHSTHTHEKETSFGGFLYSSNTSGLSSVCMKVGHKTAEQCIHFVLFSSRNKKSPQLIVRLSHCFSKLFPIQLRQLHSKTNFLSTGKRYTLCVIGYPVTTAPPPRPSSHLRPPIFCFGATNRW